MFGLVPWRRRSSELERLFEDLWKPFDLTAVSGLHGGFVPRVNVRETKDAVEIEAELPGIDTSDVDLSVHGHSLWIRGEKKDDKEEERDGYRVVERSYGRFERHIALPEHTDAEKIDASYRDGVLHVTVPKTEEAKPKKIEVKS
jgi:HSP20 family protein